MKFWLLFDIVNVPPPLRVTLAASCKVVPFPAEFSVMLPAFEILLPSMVRV